jgi:hypothetical protein
MRKPGNSGRRKRLGGNDGWTLGAIVRLALIGAAGAIVALALVSGDGHGLMRSILQGLGWGAAAKSLMASCITFCVEIGQVPPVWLPCR